MDMLYDATLSNKGYVNEFRGVGVQRRHQISAVHTDVRWARPNHENGID